MDKRQFERDWRDYETNTKDGELPDLRSLGLLVGRPRTFGFAGRGISAEQQREGEQAVARLLTYWNSQAFSTGDPAMSEEKKLLGLCLEFLQSARHAQVDKVKQYLEMGVPVNFQHPRHKYSAMHCATFENDDEDYHKLARYLLDSSYQINFLLEDGHGRVPWHCAMFFNYDEALTTEIYDRTRLQAERINLDLHADFQYKFQTQWMQSTWFEALSRKIDFTPENLKP
jgi:hypothetical protein